MKTEEELKRIFVNIVHEFHKSDISDDIVVCDYIVENYLKYDYGELLKTKTQNLLKLVNETKQKSSEEYKNFLKRDLETDVWYII